MKGGNIKRFPLILMSLMLFLSAVNVAFAPGPLLYIDPEVSTANPGDSFTINAKIQGAVDLFSYEVKMSFEPGLLGINLVEEGPFLKQTVSPFGTFFQVTVYSDYIYVVGLILGRYPGISGSGTLFSVTFNVLDAGTCDLDIFESALFDSVPPPEGPYPISHNVADGVFSNAHADLVRRSAWPEHHHYVVGKDEDAYQTLNAKAKNLGPMDVYVKVAFDIMRDDAFFATVETDDVLVTAGTIVELSADFGPLDPSYAGKYYVTARALYSSLKTHWCQGDKMKTFSFAIVP